VQVGDSGNSHMQHAAAHFDTARTLCVLVRLELEPSRVSLHPAQASDVGRRRTHARKVLICRPDITTSSAVAGCPLDVAHRDIEPYHPYRLSRQFVNRAVLYPLGTRIGYGNGYAALRRNGTSESAGPGPPDMPNCVVD
jgi:hypothetical protein